ncbi:MULTISPECIES: hypothetical protein [Synechocystis]|uniref:Uncharacterized protein n=1 Tax=Synechocystis salina LEGE 00031 TaxID=1828736 RepID=A0ABR9VT45_9SYNC|nr:MULTISPECIES: hypothetical protein [Synechocystis]MBD2654051.1 hypothetical protein [Synechocystis sp. FACHB-383]MBE9240218.1 hypothetical protein [Synechocystis salina LEGE 00041]MBE9253416.1 hypothetical protein [Synechocystis salina LEGE 00031]
MITETKNLSEITQQAIEILFKEVGISNTIRFLNQFSMGYGNYTEERRDLFEDLTMEQFLSEMENLDLDK